MPNDWTTESPYYSIDPYPDIAPSLLNSADIIRYAQKGCLVHPFDMNREALNPATYTVKFLGTLYLWEQDGRTRRPCQMPITEGEPVRLPANSISYLQTGEQFRLPQYIAARFNLHIRHVHRGILLGTGPLVDPGFIGPLLIPLHNLTDNDYDVRGGDNLLWVEFTKLTHHPYWTRAIGELGCSPPDELVLFRPRKQSLDAHGYLAKAGVETRGVVSAFKGALDDARGRAETSEKAANQAKKTVQQLIGLGAIGLVVGIGTLIFAAFQLLQGNSELAGRVHDRLDRIERAVGALPPISHGSQDSDVSATAIGERSSSPNPSGGTGESGQSSVEVDAPQPDSSST